MTLSSLSPSVPSSSTSAPPPMPSPSIEQLPANIPHLETDGSNWAIFCYVTVGTSARLEQEVTSPTDKTNKGSHVWFPSDKSNGDLYSSLMRSSNPRVLQVREEYFERIRQGMDGKDSVCYVSMPRHLLTGCDYVSKRYLVTDLRISQPSITCMIV